MRSPFYGRKVLEAQLDMLQPGGGENLDLDRLARRARGDQGAVEEYAASAVFAELARGALEVHRIGAKGQASGQRCGSSASRTGGGLTREAPSIPCHSTAACQATRFRVRLGEAAAGGAPPDDGLHVRRAGYRPA